MITKDENGNPLVKITCHLDSYHGDFYFNILEVLSEIDEELMAEFLQDKWGYFLRMEVLKNLMNEKSVPHWQGHLHEIRSLVLTSNVLPKIIQRWAKEELDERLMLESKAKFHERNYDDLLRWTRATLDNILGDQWSDEKLKVYQSIPKPPTHNYSYQYPKEEVERMLDYLKTYFQDELELFPVNEEVTDPNNEYFFKDYLPLR